MDALASARTDSENDATRRLKNELLVRMSEAVQGVLVLAATNVPWALDPAVRRRFERRIHVPLPEAEARAALLPRTPAHSRSPTLTPTTCPRHPRSSTQMFDCSDMCDCAWGGSDIVQCMMCNSKCTKKKCAEYCEKLAAGGKRRAPLSAATMGNMFGGGQ